MCSWHRYKCFAAVDYINSNFSVTNGKKGQNKELRTVEATGRGVGAAVSHILDTLRVGEVVCTVARVTLAHLVCTTGLADGGAVFCLGASVSHLYHCNITSIP